MHAFVLRIAALSLLALATAPVMAQDWAGGRPYNPAVDSSGRHILAFVRDPNGADNGGALFRFYGASRHPHYYVGTSAGYIDHDVRPNGALVTLTYRRGAPPGRWATYYLPSGARDGTRGIEGGPSGEVDLHFAGGLPITAPLPYRIVARPGGGLWLVGDRLMAVNARGAPDATARADTARVCSIGASCHIVRHHEGLTAPGTPADERFAIVWRGLIQRFRDNGMRDSTFGVGGRLDLLATLGSRVMIEGAPATGVGVESIVLDRVRGRYIVSASFSRRVEPTRYASKVVVAALDVETGELVTEGFGDSGLVRLPNSVTLALSDGTQRGVSPPSELALLPESAPGGLGGSLVIATYSGNVFDGPVVMRLRTDGTHDKAFAEEYCSAGRGVVEPGYCRISGRLSNNGSTFVSVGSATGEAIFAYGRYFDFERTYSSSPLVVPPLVTTSAAPPTEVSGAGLTLSAPSPHPVAAQARLRLAGIAAPGAALSAHVYDALGRRVRTLHEGPAGAMVLDFTFDARGLAPGLYVVRASGGGGGVVSRTLIVAR